MNEPVADVAALNTLVLGGTRSGKSRIAEAIATDLARRAPAGPHARAVTYVATARLDPTDPSHRARVETHRARRPAAWVTLECEQADDLPAHLDRAAGVVLVDSLGTWLTLDPDLSPDTGRLVDALLSRSDPTVLVSEEVGLAVHPATDVGRRYVDVMGDLNQQIAAVADRALFVVAGRVLPLDRWGTG